MMLNFIYLHAHTAFCVACLSIRIDFSIVKFALCSHKNNSAFQKPLTICVGEDALSVVWIKG